MSVCSCPPLLSDCEYNQNLLSSAPSLLLYGRSASDILGFRKAGEDLLRGQGGRWPPSLLWNQRKWAQTWCGTQRHSAKMFSNRMVEIEARPSLIGWPHPQKHFDLNGCYLGWGRPRSGEEMVEMYAEEGLGGLSLPAVELLLGMGNGSHRDKVRDSKDGSVDSFPLIWILVCKTVVKTGL